MVNSLADDLARAAGIDPTERGTVDAILDVVWDHFASYFAPSAGPEPGLWSVEVRVIDPSGQTWSDKTIVTDEVIFRMYEPTNALTFGIRDVAQQMVDHVPAMIRYRMSR